MKRNEKRHILKKLIDGYAWASRDIRILIAGFALYGICVGILAWHTDRALCWLLGGRTLFGLPYLVVGGLGVLTLVHEADYVWKYECSKIPIGILSVFFIYYFSLDLLWWIAEGVFRLEEDPAAFGTLLLMGISAGIVGIGYRNAKCIRRVSYRIPIGQIGAEFRIALISDLHLGAFVGEAHANRIVSTVNSIKPELIVIAGDILDDNNRILVDVLEMERICGVLRQLQSRYGTVLSLGNHDPNAQDPAFTLFLKKADITLLHNRVMELPLITVAGVSDPAHNERLPLEVVLENRDPGKPVVVADHDPRYMEEAVKQKVDLALFGHTHAGQFFPASFLTRLAVGKRRFYGHGQTGKVHTVVTSGAGFFNLPVRIGTYNEVAELILQL